MKGSDIIIIGVCMLRNFPFYLDANEVEIPGEKLYCQDSSGSLEPYYPPNRVFHCIFPEFNMGHMKKVKVLRNSGFYNAHQTHLL